jgi:septal ring factor EnvC (AmiA/AmiB activator)
MTQRRSTTQPFDERLYGMFIEVFRATGTMPDINQMEKIRQTCKEIMHEFVKAGGGHEALKGSLNAMKPVVANLETQIAELRDDVAKLKESNTQLQTSMKKLIRQATQLGFGDNQ